MSVATQLDLTRDDIISRFTVRIDQGGRTKLTREERENLVLFLVDRLVELNQLGKGDQGSYRANSAGSRSNCVERDIGISLPSTKQLNGTETIPPVIFSELSLLIMFYACGQRKAQARRN